MRLVIESTDETPFINGTECRLWNGTTENGCRCLVFVHRIAVPAGEPVEEFDARLLPKPQAPDWPPSQGG